jgi:hypothetical protein
MTFLSPTAADHKPGGFAPLAAGDLVGFPAISGGLLHAGPDGRVGHTHENVSRYRPC